MQEWQEETVDQRDIWITNLLSKDQYTSRAGGKKVELFFHAVKYFDVKLS